MNTPLLLALGALACSGVSDYVYKRAAMAGVAAHQLTMVQGWCYGLIVIGYGLVTGTLVFDLASLWGAVAGLFAYTGYYNFARCVQRGAVGTFSAIFRRSISAHPLARTRKAPTSTGRISCVWPWNLT